MRSELSTRRKILPLPKSGQINRGIADGPSSHFFLRGAYDLVSVSINWIDNGTGCRDQWKTIYGPINSMKLPSGSWNAINRFAPMESGVSPMVLTPYLASLSSALSALFT